jgi:hypothetical protein
MVSFRLFLFLTFINGLFSAHAQSQNVATSRIQVTYPADRMVFQRNAANQATVTVGGYYAPPVDKVEARFVPLNGGTETPWTLIQTNPKGGVYQGTMTLNAGWYRLEVRGSFQNNVVATAQQDHVGVGEVFLIMGHSNAQGGATPSRGAQDDRVNAANYSLSDNVAYNRNGDPNFLVDLKFTQLCQTCGIAPYNGVPWVWSQLGDSLVKKLNVPVSFYSAAFGGTSIQQNYKVIKGIPFQHGFVNYNIGMPYVNLKNALWRYVPSTGLRAVLAVHGENDVGESTDEIVNYYQTTIAQSRADAADTTLAWVVAISSFKKSLDGTRGESNEAVRTAQRTVISTGSYVFPGPDLDLVNKYPSERIDTLHYSELGQVKVARLWAQALTDSFFRASNPKLPVAPPPLSVACNGSNNQVLTVQGNFAAYQWSNGQQGASATATAGPLQATVRNEKGFFWFSPPVRVPDQVGPPQPVVETSGTTSFCPGGRVTLSATSPSATRFQWSSGPTDTRITVGSAGAYRIRAFDEVNCYSESSPVNVVVFPEPTKPTVAAQGSLFFCDTLTVTLAATSTGADSAYTWNSGARVRNLVVNQSGEYRVRGLNRFGCFSPESDPLRVTVVPTPEVPVIEQVGPFTLRASNGRKVSLYDWKIDNGPLSTQGNLFKTPRNGSYTVRAFLDSAQTPGGVPIRCFSRFASTYTVSLDPSSDGFVVYPVPSADGWVTLDTRDVYNNLTVSVVTTDGQVTFQQTYPTFDGRLRLYLGPQPGRYFIHARGTNLRNTKTALVR